MLDWCVVTHFLEIHWYRDLCLVQLHGHAQKFQSFAKLAEVN